jgi:hypothetical protein
VVRSDCAQCCRVITSEHNNLLIYMAQLRKQSWNTCVQLLLSDRLLYVCSTTVLLSKIVRGMKQDLTERCVPLYKHGLSFVLLWLKRIRCWLDSCMHMTVADGEPKSAMRRLHSCKLSQQRTDSCNPCPKQVASAERNRMREQSRLCSSIGSPAPHMNRSSVVVSQCAYFST